jgi:hypothetical protein
MKKYFLSEQNYTQLVLYLKKGSFEFVAPILNLLDKLPFEDMPEEQKQEEITTAQEKEGNQAQEA